MSSDVDGGEAAVAGAPIGAEAVKRLLARYGLEPRHTLGQNFIVKPEPVAAAVTAAAVGPEDTVLEIGPGLGTLTRALATQAARVVAIELDRSFVPVLTEVSASCGNVAVTYADAREVDYAALIAPASGARAKAVANLPYYATTALLERLVWSPVSFADIVVLVQVEAVGRVIASPGDEGYGPLSLLIECFYDGRLALRVPRDSFWPQPKVDSALIALRRRSDAPLPADAAKLFGLIRTAFAKRRKTLAAALAQSSGEVGGIAAISRDNVIAALGASGQRPTARAEELTLTEFRDLLTALGNQVTQQ